MQAKAPVTLRQKRRRRRRFRGGSHYGRNDGGGDVLGAGHTTAETSATAAVTFTVTAKNVALGFLLLVAKSKKPRAKWDSETEKRLIDVWADILEEFGGKMLKRKKKGGHSHHAPQRVRVQREQIDPQQHDQRSMH